MIISVSRRTDIPAFYNEWFFNRIEAGYVCVRNPMNIKQVSKISLSPEDVDCFVFWTKNAIPMIDKIHILDEKGYKYYFQYTITPYDVDAEPYVGGEEYEKKKKEKIIENFIELSKRIGKEKVIFRYDPIFINDKYNFNYHIDAFKKLSSRLKGYTEKCIISFIDFYQKTERNSKELHIEKIDMSTRIELAKELAAIAKINGMKMETCAENGDFSKVGVQAGKCIDSELVARVIGCDEKAITNVKDANQREECGCVKSFDIGEYNTCMHGCVYCYANFNKIKVKENYKIHNPKASVLIGSNPINEEEIKLKKREKVKRKKEEKIVEENKNQQQLF